MAAIPRAPLLQRLRTITFVFFHHFGIHCATHQIRLILISSVVITSLFYPALALYSSQNFDSFLGSSAVSGFYAQHDLRNIWEGHPALRVVEDAVSRAKCGKQRTLRLERVLIQNSFAENPDQGALNYQILKATLEFEQRIAKQVANHGCLTKSDGKCLVLSPLAFWNQFPPELHADTNILEWLNLSRNITVSGIPITPHMVLAGRGSFGYEQSEQYDYADYLALTFFFLDSDCLGNAGHDSWRKFIKMAASSVVEPIQRHAPTLIALEYDTSHTWQSHFSSISLFLYFAYAIFFAYVGISMRGMVAVHSRIGLTFTALVEIAVSTITSLSVCALVGFRVTMVPWELLPILIVFVGAENMFSLVNAVTQTSVTLPVKERIAVGLSHAGTSNTVKVVAYNTLLGIVAVLANKHSAGAITQFCVFAIVVLVAHWFLAHTFFIAVLSIDIQRLELSELLRQDPSLAAPPVSQSAKPSDTRGNASTLSRWESFLGAKRGFFKRRFTKDLSLVLLLAIVTTLYYATSPMSNTTEGDAHITPSRGALSKGGINMALAGQDQQSPAWHIWKTLNPEEDSLLHLRIEMPTILTLGAEPNSGDDLEYSRSKSHRIRSIKRAFWLTTGIVVVPIAATTTALYFLCLYLLKDAELLEAQRNRAEPASTDKVEEPPLQERVLFTTLPRAFPTDVELLTASKDSRVIASVGMHNELVVIWRKDHDKQVVATVDTSDILLRSASTSSAASSITALCMDEQGSFCVVGTGAGIVAVWGIDDGSLSPLSHFTQDNSSAGVVDLLFLPTTVPSSLLAVYENDTVVRWTINGSSIASYILPNHPGRVIKSMVTRMEADNRLLVGFVMENGSLQVSEVGGVNQTLMPDCVLLPRSPIDAFTKIIACTVEMNDSRHLIIGTVTEAGIISLWDGQTGECIYVFEDAYPDMGGMRLSPTVCKKCSSCGELPPESFTISFSVGNVVLFYSAYLVTQTRKCCCAYHGQRQSPSRDIHLGKRSRTTSIVPPVSTSPTSVRLRMTAVSTSNQLLPDISSFPVSGHGIHSRRASEKDASRRTDTLALPFLPDDTDSGLLTAWPSSPGSRTSATWGNLVVARLADASCERGCWDVSGREIVGVHRKSRSQRAKEPASLPVSSGAFLSKGLTAAALDRWELWTFDPTSARIRSAPLVLLVDNHLSETPPPSSMTEPPRLPFTRVSPFFSAGSHGLIGLGNTIGVFNFSSPT